MVSLVHDMSHVPPIKEETSIDLLNENKQHNVELSPRSKNRPRRDRSGTSSVSSSLRSSDGGGGLLRLQLMGASTSILDTINLEDLPQEGSRKTPRQRKPRSDAIERLHDSMSALEGISPEELVEEANRRRNERVNRYNQRTHLSASLPANGPRINMMDTKFHASAPALVSGDLRLVDGSNSSSRHVEDSIVERSAVIQTRDNSDFLWQRTPVGTECWGALELACQLEFDYRAPLQPRYVEERKEIFDKCLQVWKKMELAEEFVAACESVAPWTACCGMVRNDDRTIQETAETLRKGWIKNVNQRLKQRERIFKLDVYVWSWHNATGKAKTNILMLRFLSARRGV